MKNAAFTFVATIALSFVFAITGCSPIEENNNVENSAIGIMETRGTEKTSRIVFYDEKLNETGSLNLPYATFGGIFYNPLISQGFLYAIPQGEYDKKDGNMAVRVNLSTLSVEEYQINQPAMNAITTDSEHIWTCNTLNSESFINRCSIKDGSITSISIPKEFIMNILWKDDTLYAFGKSMETDDISIYCYDVDFNFIERIDITDKNLSVYRTAIHGDFVYFCGMGASEDAGYEGKIGVLDTRSNTVDYLDLNGKYPSSIAFYDDKLFISHYDPFQNSKTNSPFSIMDLETGYVEHFELGHPVEQIAIKDGSLFALGDTKIYRYATSNMQLINNAEIKMMPGDFSYISGMFAMT